ncbi:hypothetical protein [Escherichia coli]|uniref:hypothetical protein n=1 Tax=Escherichia coli TaxID=562 RepID=UPI0012FFB81B|nr:hypothetical protein [Escherichia coli]
MHHSDVVNIAKNNVEINHALSKFREYILNRHTRRFFYSVSSWLAASGLFISTPRPAHITSDNTTQKASAGAFDGVFFTGRWWPFFIYRRKKYV